MKEKRGTVNIKKKQKYSLSSATRRKIIPEEKSRKELGGRKKTVLTREKYKS